MERPEPAIEIRELHFAYAGSAEPAVEIETLILERGEHMLLAGPSGSGKSTLLNLICGTLTANEGTVRVLGHDLAQMRATARDRLRARELGVIFQQFNLVPYLSVMDNVLLPLRLSRQPLPDARNVARQMLTALELDPALVDRKASNLSVGQQQRVAAARAFINAPSLVIADEPTSALDPDRREGFLDLMFEHARRCDTALLVVSHDDAVASRFDKTVRLTTAGRREGA